jgi:biotin-dependent carboxylase-like uncharacterized protein
MIEVLNPGFYTSIQDLGRYGFRKYGVPVSGAMDRTSAVYANQLLGNTPNCAVLEITLIGPEFLFRQNTQIAITGAVSSCRIDNIEVAMNTALKIRAGQSLKIGNCSQGSRVYLAVEGGLDTEVVMGSRSQSKDITKAFQLCKGDLLPIRHPSSGRNEVNRVKIIEFSNASMTVSPGPEFDLLSAHMQSLLMESTFRILQDSNRIGYKLSQIEGLFAHEIITSPVQSGTVQLTPSGTLIVLMRDAPVTGGYARVLQLSAEAIDRLAQMPIRHQLKFALID